MTPCPTIAEWESLAAGAYRNEEATRLRSHARSCAACAKTLDDVCRNLGMAGSVRDALTEHGSPGGSPMGMVGRVFDGYTIRRVLGSGSSATVYEALQDRTGRLVAIKVLSTFAMSPEHLRRFEHEAKILARLRHPGIAQVFESGTITDDSGSRPYIAMELVGGKPITEHCADRNLPKNARIGLLADVCEALHHAHECGVIHRDLKPANVLVTPAGSVRIVDFGFARLTGPQTMLSTMHTAHGQIVGTVAYMSPEHITSSDGVDARSDVYSIGVIGYELLTGRLPVPVRDISIERALRAIADVEPDRLSRIDPSLSGDIETVILRALAKRPQDRYAGAGELAADLRRVIAGEPIGARRPGLIERSARFARHHRALVTGTAAVIAALLIGLAGTTFGLVRAVERTRIAEERRRSAEELASLLEKMLREAHPHEAKGRGYTVRQMLDDFSRRFEGELADQPMVEAALRTTMGTGYRVLGEYALARPHLERALALRTAEHPPSSTGIAGAMCDLAWLAHDESAYDAAIAQFLGAAGMDGIDPMIRARALLGWSDCLHHAGDIDTARERGAAALAAAIAYRDGAHGSRDSTIAVAEAHINLSRIERDAGNYPDAERELSAAMDLLRESLGSNDPRMADALNDEAWLAFLRRDYALAETTARSAMDVGERTLGENHPDLGNTKYELGMILSSRGDPAGGEALMREALEIFVRAQGENHPSTFTAEEALARIIRTTGKSEEARDLLVRALEGRRAFFGERNVEVGYALSGLAMVQRDLKDLDGAERSAQEAIDIYREAYGKPHPFIAKAQGTLGAIAMDRGDKAGAQARYEEAAATMEAAVGSNHADTLLTLATLGECLEARENWAGALAQYNTVVARCGSGTPPVRSALAHQGLGRCLVALDRAREGVEEHRLALDALVAIGPTNPVMEKRIATAREELAKAQERAGDDSGAAATRSASATAPK